MKTRKFSNYFNWLLVLLFCSCEEPYMPSVINMPNRFLVVSGFINTSDVPTLIRLSRTQNLSESRTPTPETGAMVQIEDESGIIVARLIEQSAGFYYTSGKVDYNFSKKYRLFIRTAYNEYASEFVPVQVTPPIDSVSWKLENNGLQLYVNTHDANNSTRYYRWEFEDTWEYTSNFDSYLEYKDGKIVPRSPENKIYVCWQSGRSTNIHINNSTKLSQDIIREMPLLWLHSGSEKIGRKYSILVKQYALTREAFEYWDILKRNNESIGTLFDPLPSKLNGNIKCLTNPSEPVIGYIGASTVTEKRVFISKIELPAAWWHFTSNCRVDTIAVSDVEQAFESGGSIPISEYISGDGSVLGYLSSFRGCVDCTITGTNIKPAYWK